MDEAGKLLIGKGEQPQYLQLPLANRHGLIAGATGTGKTITLQVLAEQFSRAGVPVFCADVKGDLSGIAEPGAPKPKIEQRAAELGVTDFAYAAAPVIFWDLYGEQGHPIRATVAEMGPLLLARMLELNDDPGGRAQHRLQAGRRPGPAAARLQGPDRDPAGRGRERRPADHHLRQCQQGHDRHHPAPPADARAAGGRAFLRRAGAGAVRPDAARRRTGAVRSTCWWPTS